MQQATEHGWISIVSEIKGFGVCQDMFEAFGNLDSPSLSHIRQACLLRLNPKVYSKQDDRERQFIAYITRLELSLRLRRKLAAESALADNQSPTASNNGQISNG